MSVRPEDVYVHKQAPSRTTNMLNGTVASVMFVGEFLDCRVDIGGQELRSRQHPNIGLQLGDKVQIELPPESCAVLREDFEATSAGAVDEGAALASATS